MNESLHIRPYTADDFNVLVSLLEQNIPESFAPSEANDFRIYLKERLEDYFVVELDGILAGSGGINYSPDKCRGIISWDLIAPSQQGKGIGSALIKHRLNHLKSLGQITEVIVRTSQTAFPFYAKHGFEITYTEKDYWAPGYDLVEMKHADFN